MDSWGRHVAQMANRRGDDVYTRKNHRNGLGRCRDVLPVDLNKAAKKAEGVYGKVYIFKDCVIKEPKLTKDDERYGISPQLLKEIVALQNLHHPNIVYALGWYRIGGRLFIEMPNCGIPLLHFQRMMCAKYQVLGLPDELIRSLFAQLLEGISYMHAHGYIHLDIKEDNLLVKADGDKVHLTIIDCSLSEWIGVECQISDFYKQATWHRAPEVCFNIPYSYSADIWSLGCVLFYMIESRYLFNTTNETEIKKQYIKYFGRPTEEEWADGHAALEMSEDLCDVEQPPSAREDQKLGPLDRLKDAHGYTISSTHHMDEMLSETVFQKAPPYIQYTIRRLFRTILTTKPGPLLVDLLARCWQMNPDKRNTAKELLYHPFIGKGLPPNVGLMVQNYLHLIVQEPIEIPTVDDTGIVLDEILKGPALAKTESVLKPSSPIRGAVPIPVPIKVHTPRMRTAQEAERTLTANQQTQYALVHGAYDLKMNADSTALALWICWKLGNKINCRELATQVACLGLGSKMHDTNYESIYKAYVGIRSDVIKRESEILNELGGDLQQTLSTQCLRTYVTFLSTLVNENRPSRDLVAKWRRIGENLLVLLCPCLIQFSPDVLAMAMLHFLAPDWSGALELFTGLSLDKYAHVSVVIRRLIGVLRYSKQIPDRTAKMFVSVGRRLGLWE